MTGMPSSGRWAPAPGADPDFEKMSEAVNDVLDADPATASKLSDAVRRETLARALSRFGGKAYSSPGAADYDDAPASPDEPEPDQAIEPRELVIPESPPGLYWYEDPADAEFLEHYILSRVALGARLPGGLLITGPAGSGKTRGVINAVESLNARHPELGLPLLVMNCPTLTDEQKWFGRREIDKDGSRYEKSDFVAAVESGAVILLDEFMRLHPRIHNPVMSLLDGSEAVLLSDLNLTITRHPRTVFIGTTNIGAQFGGTHRMDWAMRERWSFTIEREFPPAEEEARILMAHNPGCDADAANVLVDIAVQSRRMWQTGDLRAPISTRTLDNAAFLVASGYTEREAMERTVVPEYDSGAEGIVGLESERAKVRGIIDGRTTR